MICTIPVTWGGINSVQVLAYGFLTVMTLHGIRDHHHPPGLATP
jgi:hypothetical protein